MMVADGDYSRMIIDSSMIAYFATRNIKNMTDEKAAKIVHAFEVNKAIEMGLLLPTDAVCMFRNCFHHFSYHGN